MMNSRSSSVQPMIHSVPRSSVTAPMRGVLESGFDPQAETASINELQWGQFWDEQLWSCLAGEIEPVVPDSFIEAVSESYGIPPIALQDWAQCAETYIEAGISEYVFDTLLGRFGEASAMNQQSISWLSQEHDIPENEIKQFARFAIACTRVAGVPDCVIDTFLHRPLKMNSPFNYLFFVAASK